MEASILALHAKNDISAFNLQGYVGIQTQQTVSFYAEGVPDEANRREGLFGVSFP